MRLSAAQKEELLTVLEGCRTAEAGRLRARLFRLLKQGKLQPADVTALQTAMATSQATVAEVRAGLPVPSFGGELPVVQRRDDIIRAIQGHQVVVVAGETGSGKTTQLPKLCLAAGFGARGLIGHTQPRRIAARSVANRIAEELGTTLGDQVGFQVRFAEQVSERSCIKVMTDGILLAELAQDRYLSRYEVLIVDEAHERSLNIDFLLGYLRQLLPKRPDLKLIITSATIDVERFSRHFDNAPVILVEGRTYPVETWCRPLSEQAVTSEEDEGFEAIEEGIPRGVLAAVEECIAAERKDGKRLPGDFLVFAATEREIREIAEVLRKYGPPHTEVLPLYARLSLSEQQKIFQPHGGRRIVIATNVAETSLTVPNIHYVIDPGFARLSRYSWRSKVQRLPVEAVSQASANQRQGRCGRIAPGICVRLYSEADFLARPEFTDAEILRTNLAAVILQMAALRLGAVEAFPFLDAPDSRLVNDGYRLLEELGAVDKERQLSRVGQQVAAFPLDPRLARMLIAGARHGALSEVLIIVSALSVQDPRERPQDKQQAADERHAKFRHAESDFLFYVNLWTALEAMWAEGSNRERQQFARQHFLSWLRLREWREAYRQLAALCKEQGLRRNDEPASYDAVHKALLTGLLSLVATTDEDRSYLAPRNQRVWIFPGSALAKKGPKWLLAAEFVETAKVYARTVARIEPEWIEELAPELLKRTYLEPHWEKRQGRVVVYEQSSLYGLVINPRKRVGYESIDPTSCREIFLRQALVAGELHTRAPFFRHNQALIAELETLENKARRRDILVDEETLFGFYAQRVPTEVVSAQSFEHWRERAERETPKLLFLSREDLLAGDEGGIDRNDFPDHIQWQGQDFRLHYHFEPGHFADGVTAIVPVGVLQLVPEQEVEWLVPGLRQAKVVELLRLLPKHWRRQLVPLPDTAARLMPLLAQAQGPFVAAVRAALLRVTGVEVPAAEWPGDGLSAHCHMNFRVLTPEGKVLGEGRDLKALQRALVAEARAQVAGAGEALERQGLRQWDFGDLPEQVERQVRGQPMRAWPALVDEGDAVAIRLFATPEEAAEAHPEGQTRLAMLTLSAEARHVRKALSDRPKTLLLYASLGDKEQLLSQWTAAVFRHVLVQDQPSMYTRACFERRLAERTSQLLPEAQRLAELLSGILEANARVAGRLKALSGPFLPARADIEQQLKALDLTGFLAQVPVAAWQHYPRYLKAMELRLDKLPNNLVRDTAALQEVQALEQQCRSRGRLLAERGMGRNAHLEQYRWLLEEYRVSLFAQPLKTAVPVSRERLVKLWAQIGT